MTLVRGTVIEIRPKLLYRIRLEGGEVVVAGQSTELRHIVSRLLVGDDVLVQLSAFDPHRGQIIRKAQ
jgi:translation initiation factor IF-1